MAVGLVVNNFAFEERADASVGEVPNLVGTGSQIGGQGLAVFAGNALANEFADVNPHLLVRLEGLLQLVFLCPLTIEDGEGGAGCLGAAIANGDDGAVLRVILPLASRPMRGKLIGKRRLRAP